MREQLEQYVKLLFAGTPDSEDMQQEILQNTLDRYDDLVEQGKSPEAAYRLAISGIGDIGEILGSEASPTPVVNVAETSEKNANKKLMRAVAIGMYICSAIPLFILGGIGGGVIGLSLTCLLVAAATALMVMSSGGSAKQPTQDTAASANPQAELRKAIKTAIGLVTLFIYLLISFWSGAWFITWLIFPIMGAVRGIVIACMDIKEANKHES